MIFRKACVCVNYTYPLRNIVQRLWVVLLAIGSLVERQTKYITTNRTMFTLNTSRRTMYVLTVHVGFTPDLLRVVTLNPV